MHNSEYRFSVDNIQYDASELSSMILKKLTKDASKTIGTIKDVVISVPAYFKESQRNATIRAGELAGLNVIGIINEPTAAALYYATTEETNGIGLIYDLGGGTFDATVVKTNGNNIKILSSAGDHHLGGVDFDMALLNIFEEKYRDAKNHDLYNDEESKQEFLLLAEEVKKKLSTHPKIKQKLRGDGGSAVVEITQEEFEEKISMFISRTELLLEQVLDEAEVEAEQIDYVLLVGGSTRIPIVSKSIKSIIGKEPISKVNVDEAVALGATIKAGLITLEKNPNSITQNVARELKTIRSIDVANHSYGTISLSFDEITQRHINMNTIIIEKNTPLPCSFTETFYTTFEGQTAIDITVTQGEDADPDFVDKIYENEMDLPPNRPTGQPIEITYRYDENQMMHCTFKDVNSGQIKEVQLHNGQERATGTDLNSFLIE
jgi:molecular chaperone DnaK